MSYRDGHNPWCGQCLAGSRDIIAQRTSGYVSLDRGEFKGADASPKSWNMQTESLSHTARVNVLGVAVSAIDMDQAVELSDRLIQTGGKGYVCVTGVHGVMEAQRDPALRQVLNRAFLVTPDGMPTVWMGHLQGCPAMRRVYGPDYMMAMCRLSLKRRYRHFLYGGGVGVAERLKHRLEVLLPGIEIAGTYAPPFRPLLPCEEKNVAEMVSQCRPDILWVGMSTPKQERFMAQYIERLDVHLMVGVGAAFDIHAGITRDAHPWVKKCGLQWLDRLIREPRRLWRRYLLNNPPFVWNACLQLTKLRRFEIQ